MVIARALARWLTGVVLLASLACALAISHARDAAPGADHPVAAASQASETSVHSSGTRVVPDRAAETTGCADDAVGWMTPNEGSGQISLLLLAVGAGTPGRLANASQPMTAGFELMSRHAADRVGLLLADQSVRRT